MSRKQVPADAETALRTARNSKPLEVLGTYDPIPRAPLDGEGAAYKDIRLDRTRAQYWLGVGAQPSDTAWRLLAMVRRPSRAEAVFPAAVWSTC